MPKKTRREKQLAALRRNQINLSSGKEDNSTIDQLNTNPIYKFQIKKSPPAPDKNIKIESFNLRDLGSIRRDIYKSVFFAFFIILLEIGVSVVLK